MMENLSTIGGYEQGGMYVNRAPQGFLARQKHTEARAHVHKHALHHATAGFMRTEQKVL